MGGLARDGDRAVGRLRRVSAAGGYPSYRGRRRRPGRLETRSASSGQALPYPLRARSFASAFAEATADKPLRMTEGAGFGDLALLVVARRYDWRDSEGEGHPSPSDTSPSRFGGQGRARATMAGASSCPTHATAGAHGNARPVGREGDHNALADHANGVAVHGPESSSDPGGGLAVGEGDGRECEAGQERQADENAAGARARVRRPARGWHHHVPPSMAAGLLRGARRDASVSALSDTRATAELPRRRVAPAYTLGQDLT
jgi:hypothetical protein